MGKKETINKWHTIGDNSKYKGGNTDGQSSQHKEGCDSFDQTTTVPIKP